METEFLGSRVSALRLGFEIEVLRFVWRLDFGVCDLPTQSVSSCEKTAL
jgi:hypothetical protein